MAPTLAHGPQTFLDTMTEKFQQCEKEQKRIHEEWQRLEDEASTILRRIRDGLKALLKARNEQPEPGKEGEIDGRDKMIENMKQIMDLKDGRLPVFEAQQEALLKEQSLLDAHANELRRMVLDHVNSIWSPRW